MIQQTWNIQDNKGYSILSEEIIGGWKYKMILRNVQGYQKCQQNKVQHIKKIRELHLLEISQEL